MRVIAGEYKGRKLLAPQTAGTRPTTERVKEAIFSIALPYLEDAICIDLFSGSGAIGIEALSRGAAKVYFCDANQDAISTIKKNLEYIKADARAIIIRGTYERAIFRVREEYGDKADIIFVDAPYDMWEYYPTLFAELSTVLADGGILILERDARKDAYAEKVPRNFALLKEKRYGKIGVDVWEYRQND